jgi:hypothetical protein
VLISKPCWRNTIWILSFPKGLEGKSSIRLIA